MQNSFRQLVEHGYATLFVVAFVERLGLPLFVTPVVVAAGLLAADGRLDLLWIIAVTTVAALLGDWLWFELGRRRGSKVIDFLCRISLSKDSCVRRTQVLSARHAEWSLLYSKWVPGVAHLSPPLAGHSGMSLVRFGVFNSIGTFVWVTALALFGWISMRPLEWTSIGTAVLGLLPLWLLTLLVGNLLWKYVQKRRFVRSLRVERITAAELFARLEGAGDDKPMVLDLRHPLDVLHDPRTIPGALNVLPEDIDSRAKDLPLEGEVVLVCT